MFWVLSWGGWILNLNFTTLSVHISRNATPNIRPRLHQLGSPTYGQMVGSLDLTKGWGGELMGRVGNVAE